MSKYAHEEGVVHRDIKPENMLLGQHQEVLLSDFGIAVTVTQYVHPREAIGTAAYMAPEQFRGEPHRASDQYALAVVVYEWLCGMRPFKGDYLQLGYQHVHEPPPPLRDKVPTIPQTVELVVLRALAKNPKDRFGSVQEFDQRLEQASQTEKPLNFVSTQEFKPPTTVALPAFLAHSPAASPPMGIDQVEGQPKASVPQFQPPVRRPAPIVPVTPSKRKRMGPLPKGILAALLLVVTITIIGVAVISSPINPFKAPPATNTRIATNPTPTPTPTFTPTPTPTLGPTPTPDNTSASSNPGAGSFSADDPAFYVVIFFLF